MDKNKYLDKFGKVATECGTELIQLFIDNKIKKIEFNEDEMDYPLYIRIIGDEEFDSAEIMIDSLELNGTGDCISISIAGHDKFGIDRYAFIDKDGGEYFDVEHSLGNIYASVVEYIESISEKKK